MIKQQQMMRNPAAEAEQNLSCHITNKGLSHGRTLLAAAFALALALVLAVAGREGEPPLLPLKPRAISRLSSSPALDCLPSNLPDAELIEELPPRFLRCNVLHTYLL